jgi:uncharacterized protein (DUF427 family)
VTFAERPVPEPIGAGEESAWDYPRPPRLEPTDAHLVVVLADVVIADTRRAFRVLETSHPPNYYFPPADIAPGTIEPSDGTSFCEWKGRATYHCVRARDRVEPDAAWTYLQPSPAFAAIRGYVAFYAQRMDRCTVDGEIVEPQPGGFYGGWITSRVKGPFKGIPGSRGW